MPVQRQWRVPEDFAPEIGFAEDGSLLLQPRVVSDRDEDALMEAVLEAVAILRRVGGTIQIGSQRGEIAPDVIVTQSYIFAYDSFVPLVSRLDRHEPEEEEEPPEDEVQFPPVDDGALGEAIAHAQAEEPAVGDPKAEEELDRAAGAVE